MKLRLPCVRHVPAPGVVALAVMLAWLAQPAAFIRQAGAECSEANNAVSRFHIDVDGQFTDEFEWSDVMPLAFVSPPDPMGPLFRTCPDDPLANSFLYAALAPEEVGPGGELEIDDLYLMYDYLPRTNPNFMPGEFIADVSFPINLPEALGGGKRLITVQVRGAQQPIDSFFDVFVELHNGTPPLPPDLLGLDLDAAAGFGPSPHSPVPHLLVELEVSLRIPAGFANPAGPLPGNGINPETGLYDPDPAFWGGGFANDANDPPGTAAFFQINPDGSTTADSSIVPLVGTAAPTVDCSVSKSSLSPPNHKLVNVGLSVEASEGTTVAVSVFSDEDDLAPGSGAHSPDAADIAPGTLRLRAERSGSGDGRVYLILVTATDEDGNVAFDCCTVVVPRDQSAASRNAVAEEADEAEAGCTPLGPGGGLTPVGED